MSAVGLRLGRRRPPLSEKGTYLRNVLIENVKGVADSRIANSITGVPGLRPSNITLRNVELICHIYGKNAAKRDVQLAFSRFQQQHPNDPLQLTQWNDAHDRFIVCDDTVWLCGASVKDAGRKMFALVKMSTSPDFILNTLPANP